MIADTVTIRGKRDPMRGAEFRLTQALDSILRAHPGGISEEAIVALLPTMPRVRGYSPRRRRLGPQPEGRDKTERYKNRCLGLGLCPHCGQPCAPYRECAKRRDARMAYHVFALGVRAVRFVKRQVGPRGACEWALSPSEGGSA